MKLNVKHLKQDEEFKGQLMVFKILAQYSDKIIVILGNSSGEIKATIQPYKDLIVVGDVLEVTGLNNRTIEINTYKVIDSYDIEEFLPSLSQERIQQYIFEIESLTNEEIKSKEARCLNDYFFNDKEFLEKFMKGIGGLVQHHNYLGGLLQHTLNVMYLTSVYAKRYAVPHGELAILGAKLHDIGKIYEYDTTGPFKVSMRGEMEGHIVIGVGMLEEAFEAGGDNYSKEFKDRLRGILVQHHGKVEYGSPKSANTPEAYIVNLADQADAVMNKINSIKEKTEEGHWSEYDRRIGTRLLF